MHFSTLVAARTAEKIRLLLYTATTYTWHTYPVMALSLLDSSVGNHLVSASDGQMCRILWLTTITQTYFTCTRRSHLSAIINAVYTTKSLLAISARLNGLMVLSTVWQMKTIFDFVEHNVVNLQIDVSLMSFAFICRSSVLKLFYAQYRIFSAVHQLNTRNAC